MGNILQNSLLDRTLDEKFRAGQTLAGCRWWCDTSKDRANTSCRRDGTHRSSRCSRPGWIGRAWPRPGSRTGIRNRERRRGSRAHHGAGTHLRRRQQPMNFSVSIIYYFGNFFLMHKQLECYNLILKHFLRENMLWHLVRKWAQLILLR